MTDGAYELQIHNPAVGEGSLLRSHDGLTGAEAVALMEQNEGKVFSLIQCGKPTAADHEALRDFQIRPGMRLLPN